MKEGEDLVVKLHWEAVERMRQQPPPPPPERPTIHYTELGEASPNDPLFHEWNFYRREVGRLIAEGRQGQFVLIKDEQLVGVYATHDEAMLEGYKRFLRQAFLVHQVQEREPVLRFTRMFYPGFLNPCRS
jgi:hypothetical protein